MLHLILGILLSFTAIAKGSQRVQECLTKNLKNGLNPSREQQSKLVLNQRKAAKEQLARSGIDPLEMNRIEVTEGQAGLDRLYRQYLMQKIHPATYTKHTKAIDVADAIKRSSGPDGAAQFLPGLVREKIEVRALRELPGIHQNHGGTMYKFVRFDNVVGYDRGQPTKWMRVEVSVDGSYHGHPMGFDRVTGSCGECKEFGQ